MPENVKYIALDKVTHTNAKSKHHVPSTVQADTLFTFTSHVDYLITTIRNSMISPRYCAEDLGYLKISGIKKMAFPMNCFCDINMHKLEDHLSWYRVLFQHFSILCYLLPPIHITHMSKKQLPFLSCTFLCIPYQRVNRNIKI